MIMKRKMYIAGKITGDKNFREKFMKAQKKFENMGFAVLNPAELPAGMSPGDYMRMCLSMIDSCDVAYFLKDYIDSRGAQIEVRYADYIQKELWYESNNDH